MILFQQLPLERWLEFFWMAKNSTSRWLRIGYHSARKTAAIELHCIGRSLHGLHLWITADGLGDFAR